MKPITYALDAQGAIYIGRRVIARDNPNNPDSAPDIAGLVFRANMAGELLAACQDALAVEIEAGFPDSELAGRLRAAITKATGDQP